MGRGERRGCRSSRLLTAIGQAVFSDIFFIFRDIVQGKKSYFSVSPAPSQLPLVLAAEPCWVAGERRDPCQGILCLCCQHEAAVLTDTPRQPKGVAPLFSGLYDICVG